MSTTLPAWPFAEWLHHQEALLGREEVKARLQIGGDALLVLLALEPGDQIPLKVADRCITRMDGPDTLASLYPPEPADPRRCDLGRSYVCDERILLRAHAMHMDGMSVRAVAREIFEDCFSASPNALANALLSAFKGRGWEIRDRREATALSNRDRSWRPRCSHVRSSGDRCDRQCVGNDETCWRHDPERIAAGIARLRSTGVAA